MNKATFYALIEGDHLLRDQSIFLEVKGAYDPERGTTAPGAKPKKAKSKKAKPVKDAPAVAAEVPKSTPITPEQRAANKAAGEARRTGDKDPSLWDSSKTNRDLRVENARFRRTDAGEKAFRLGKPKWYQVTHRRHPVGAAVRDVANKGSAGAEKLSTAVGQGVSRLHGSVAQSGHLATLAKLGAVGIPSAIAGAAYSANKTRQYVNKLPAVKAAKEWGPYIKKAKKYGPYVAAGGVGLMAAKALSSDD